MTPEEINLLRKEVKKMLIDLDLEPRKAGLRTILAKALTEKTGSKISGNTLVMALSGYRSTPRYQSIIEDFHALLMEKKSAHGELIHEGEKKTINL